MRSLTEHAGLRAGQAAGFNRVEEQLGGQGNKCTSRVNTPLCICLLLKAAAACPVAALVGTAAAAAAPAAAPAVTAAAAGPATR